MQFFRTAYTTQIKQQTFWGNVQHVAGSKKSLIFDTVFIRLA